MNRPAHLSPSYQLDWHDEFEGNALDLSKWAYEWSGMRDAAYQSPEAVSVRSSCLSIGTIPMGEGRWIAGGVTTKGIYMPIGGYFEARIKVPYQSGPQFWGAYWLWSTDVGSILGDPASGTEMDVMESMRHAEGLSHCAIHWDGYGIAHRQEYWQPEIADPFGWHVYGLRWELDGVGYFIDGVRVALPSARSPVSTNPNQFMRLSCHLLDANAIAAADEMLVDWVRVWRQSE